MLITIILVVLGKNHVESVLEVCCVEDAIKA